MESGDCTCGHCYEYFHLEWRTTPDSNVARSRIFIIILSQKECGGINEVCFSKEAEPLKHINHKQADIKQLNAHIPSVDVMDYPKIIKYAEKPHNTVFVNRYIAVCV